MSAVGTRGDCATRPRGCRGGPRPRRAAIKSSLSAPFARQVCEKPVFLQYSTRQEIGGGVAIAAAHGAGGGPPQLGAGPVLLASLDCSDVRTLGLAVLGSVASVLRAASRMALGLVACCSTHRRAVTAVACSSPALCLYPAARRPLWDRALTAFTPCSAPMERSPASRCRAHQPVACR